MLFSAKSPDTVLGTVSGTEDSIEKKPQNSWFLLMRNPIFGRADSVEGLF